MRGRLSYYFITPDENRYTIGVFNDEGTEEARVTGMTREQSERTLELAGSPVRYDARQLKPDIQPLNGAAFTFKTLD